ncbi:MAG: B12-binding domain-containing radical SAM protein [Sedimentisphaerales bacterium]|nr:B12-binding domain-containing radical SAM protein [Sedimentisphaerales bacterium]
MNVLLVYPEYPATFWSFKHALKFISKKAVFPPLGLLTIAPLLPKQWNKKLIDLNITELTDEHIAWADLVFISAMIIQMDSAQEVIQRCRAQGKTIVAGGPAASSFPEKLSGVDHFVFNEAEETLPQLVADLQAGTAQPSYTSDHKPDITKTPIPQWSLINLKDYATMAIQYSRGCPFNCEFCDIVSMYGRVPRTKTPQQLINEIQSLHDAGYKGEIFIVDDNFIGSKSKVKQMLPELIAWQKKNKYPFKFYTEASLNLAQDQELMRLMSAANFHKVFLGIETPNLDSLKECEKFQNTNQSLEESVRIIHKNGLQVMGGFIVGFDNDTESIFEAQIKFIQKVGIVTAMVGILNAIPKTRLWHRLKAEGRLLKDTSGENTDATLNFIPKMGQSQLVQGYRQILNHIYSPKHYYARINTFIKHYQPSAKSRFNFKDIIPGIRSMWSIGILSRSRFLYWKLLLKTSLRRIKTLPLAIELAIYGLHFEKITNKINTK